MEKVLATRQPNDKLADRAADNIVSAIFAGVLLAEALDIWIPYLPVASQGRVPSQGTFGAVGIAHDLPTFVFLCFVSNVYVSNKKIYTYPLFSKRLVTSQ